MKQTTIKREQPQMSCELFLPDAISTIQHKMVEGTYSGSEEYYRQPITLYPKTQPIITIDYTNPS